MGIIHVELQDENGKSLQRVADPQSVLAHALPDCNDETFVCLRFVDPYGDTTFNTLQCGVLVGELQRVADGGSEEARAYLAEIERLARRVTGDVHLYLKFIGD